MSYLSLPCAHGVPMAQPCDACEVEWFAGRPPLAAKVEELRKYLGVSPKKVVKCDCGAAKAQTTHADWCSLVEEQRAP